MDKFEHSIKILDKVLNGKLFLGEYPMVDRVSVSKYGDGIEIVMIVGNVGEYWPFRDKAHEFISDLRKMLGITSEIRINIYP